MTWRAISGRPDLLRAPQLVAAEHPVAVGVKVHKAVVLLRVGVAQVGGLQVVQPPIRGLHSSTFRLKLSTFCGIRWVVSVVQ
jgi:hypothetical protein